MGTNGQLSSSELKDVGNGIRLATNTANAYISMSTAYSNDTGKRLRISTPYGGYRDLDMQRRIRSDPAVSASTATPGNSSHGLGTAVDINNWSEAQLWLSTHAKEYGFSRSIPGEGWHYQHDGSVMTSTNPFDALNPFSSFAKVGETLGNPEFWKRFGIGALGVVLLTIALIAVAYSNPVATEIRGTVKEVAGVAAKVATKGKAPTPPTP